MEFSSPNRPELPDEGCARWGEFAAQHRLPDAVRFAVDHALTEHLQNIVNHSGAAQVTVFFQLEPDSARVTVSDDGVEFDPTRAPEVDTTVPLEDRPIGGLGIHMMRRLTDSLRYQRLPGTNRLEIAKRLGPA